MMRNQSWRVRSTPRAWTILCLLVVSLASPLRAADPALPNLKITPGVYRTDLSQAKMCHTKWGLDKRHVTEKMKAQVFAQYGISEAARHIQIVKVVKGKKVTQTAAKYEIDHLISRELGGADVIKNLWPESYYSQPWNAHRKDRLENYLHQLVCEKKQITLEEARREIVNDWRKAYRKYFGTPPTAP